MLEHGIKVEHLYSITILYHIVLAINSVLLIYPLLAPAIKNDTFISIFWVFALFIVLVVSSIVNLIFSQFSQFHITILMINILILSSLISWQVLLTQIIAGIGFVLCSYFYLFEINITNINFSLLKYKTIYLLSLISGSLLIFLKARQDEHEIAVTRANFLNKKVDTFENKIEQQEKEIVRLNSITKKILRNVSHELRIPVSNVTNFSQMIKETLNQYGDKQLNELSHCLYSSSNRLSTMILNMLDLATLDIEKIDLDKQSINLSKLAINRITICQEIYLEDKELDFNINIEPEIMALVDINYMQQVIDNLVINAINYSRQSGLIEISLKSTQHSIEFIISDTGIGIPKHELYKIFDPFIVSSKTETPAYGRGIGLALCRSAIEAHGGTIYAKSDGNVGALFRFILINNKDNETMIK